MIEGELEHQDSMGNQDVIRVGEVQRMTAGTGVVHSSTILKHICQSFSSNMAIP